MRKNKSKNHCSSHFQRQEWCFQCQRMPLGHCTSHFKFYDFCPQCRHANNMPLDQPSVASPQPKETTYKAPRPRLAVVADYLAGKVRAGFTDPLDFLKNGSPDVLVNLLLPEDFDFVMREREKLKRPAPPAAPVPAPARSRDDITAEVLRRHAGGLDAVQIARNMNIARTLAQYIIDNK